MNKGKEGPVTLIISLYSEQEMLENNFFLILVVHGRLEKHQRYEIIIEWGLVSMPREDT